MDAAKAKAAARLSQFPAAGDAAAAAAEWGCPKCRVTYPAAGIPSTYTCFCGKGARSGGGGRIAEVGGWEGGG